MDISKLNHVIVGDTNGAFVLVLQDGALITAEDRAMLQSMYSRDPGSVLAHLEKVGQVGSGKFMDQFYVGYNHKSIGDCGDTTIFIENVSMLVAKAVQDWPLYNGQEVSTRYVDFSQQSFVNPLGITEGNPQDSMRAFYLEALPVVKEDLRHRYPKADEENGSFYEKAIAARAFDILRSFLPAGAGTNLAWTTNLRQAADKLAYLRWHPLLEVRTVGSMVDEALKKAHAHSFNLKKYDESEFYRMTFMTEKYYFSPDSWRKDVKLVKNMLDSELLLEHEEMLNTRPPKTELPKQLAEVGTIQFEFSLDFGSFRDIQRQRSVIQRMPMLTPKLGFHPWYLEQLPILLRDKASQVIEESVRWWKDRVQDCGEAVLQYYLPMGFLVACRVTGDLPAMVYVVELRAGSTVHPTLRHVAQEMGKQIREVGVPVHIDESDMSRFDINRGKQDIISKTN